MRLPLSTPHTHNSPAPCVIPKRPLSYLQPMVMLSRRGFTSRPTVSHSSCAKCQHTGAGGGSGIRSRLKMQKEGGEGDCDEVIWLSSRMDQRHHLRI